MTEHHERTAIDARGRERAETRPLYDAASIIEDIRSHESRGWELERILNEDSCFRIRYGRDARKDLHGEVQC